jgi:uncharacterized protein
MKPISRRQLIQGMAAVAALPLAEKLNSNNAFTFGLSCKKALPVIPEQVVERFQSLPFEFQQIDGLFAERMKVNVEHGLLHIDEAEYLSGFFQRPKEPVSGDLASGTAWVGEHIGKWLDATSNSLRNSDNTALHQLADRMAAALISTQEPDGYLGTYAPNLRWTGWDVWTHKYNLIGLLSYYELTGNPAVLAACRKMGDLLATTFGDAPGQRDIEFNALIERDLASGTVGGIESTSVLEPVCKLYRYTGDPRHLELARYIVRAYEHPGAPNIVKMPIDADSISRGKAYEMMSNLVGLVDLYRITGDDTLLHAVLRHWDNIRRNQLYMTGTVASRENFQPPGRLLSLFSSGVGENCATVTWLQLNWRLLRLTGEARYGHEIEKTVYNQLLAAHDPETGGFSYNTSLTGRKEFQSGLICCISSGKRGLSLLPALVWGTEQNAFVINLYAPGRASFTMNEVPVQVVSETQFPSGDTVWLKIQPKTITQFTLRLRVPEWAERFEVIVGDQKLLGTAGQMLDITRSWSPASKVQIRTDLSTRVISGAPIYEDYVALQRGPQVLVMEKRLNPDAPYLHRTALKTSESTVSATSITAPSGWKGKQVYAVDGIVGLPAASGGLAPKESRLVFVPFADAIEYRGWTVRSQRLRLDEPAVTAFERAGVSPDNLRPGADPLEAITDENPRTFCICDPRSYGLKSIARGTLGKLGEPVSFNVTLDSKTRISRIVFRHGTSTEKGGWFDTSGGRPYVEISRTPKHWDGLQDQLNWERVAEVDSYPLTNAETNPQLSDGQLFQVALPVPIEVYAVRIVGTPAREHASCGELSAYS